MKTTIEIPDALFRKAKSAAAESGQTLKQFVNDALRAKLGRSVSDHVSADPEWMSGFGKLHRLRKETARIQGIIDEEFAAVEPEDRL